VRTSLRLLCSAAVLGLPMTAGAAAAAPAIPTLGDIFKASGITEAGYVDASWNYNNRQYDAAPLSYGGANVNSFALNQVGLMLTKLPAEGFGGAVDLLGGHDAAGVPSDGGGDVIFKQAFIQYATGGLTLIGGRFVTLAGSEVINDSQNSNATRSLLFFYQPLVHTGVRGSYKFNDMLTVVAGANNSTGFGGAGAVVNDTNEQKTGELSFALTPKDGISIALTGYKGTEAPGQSPLLVDLVVSVQATKALSLGVNADHLDYDAGPAPGASKTKTDGAAVYANFQLTDALRAGARGEYVTTKNFGVGVDRKQKEVTLTTDYAASSAFDLLADVRYDKDDSSPFFSAFDTSGPPVFTSAKDSMVTVVLKAIYKF